ncbi:MAG: cytochrome c [Pedosphaera sp.]|nr:cytochrome c [Pedosphaera sp.]
MRYLLAAFALMVCLVVGLAGFRGDNSRRTPIEIFPDMDRQPKLRPMEPNRFFASGNSSQPILPGTVARTTAIAAKDRPVMPYEDHPVNTGRTVGTTNHVESIPVAVTLDLLARGRERYQISCVPCHGAQGDGGGVVKKFGFAAIPDLHQERVVKMPDGQIYRTLTYGNNEGSGLMSGYGANIDVRDRWAIVAYVRALQRSRLGTADEVPAAAASKGGN